MDVDGMRQSQSRARRGEFANDLTRCHIEMVDDLVEIGDVAGSVLLPDFDATGVDDLHAVSLGGSQQPGDECIESITISRLDRLHDEMIVAHQHEESLVDAGRVGEFFVGMSSGEGRDGGVKSRGVAHAEVAVTGREGAWDTAECAAMRARRAFHDFAMPFFLGPHLASGIHLRAGDMAVHVDTPRHHDEASSIDLPVGASVRVGRRLDHPSIGDPDVLYLPLQTVGRVVHVSAGDPQRGCHRFRGKQGETFARCVLVRELGCLTSLPILQGTGVLRKEAILVGRRQATYPEAHSRWL